MAKLLPFVAPFEGGSQLPEPEFAMATSILSDMSNNGGTATDTSPPSSVVSLSLDDYDHMPCFLFAASAKDCAHVPPLRAVDPAVLDRRPSLTGSEASCPYALINNPLSSDSAPTASAAPSPRRDTAAVLDHVVDLMLADCAEADSEVDDLSDIDLSETESSISSCNLSDSDEDECSVVPYSARPVENDDDDDGDDDYDDSKFADLSDGSDDEYTRTLLRGHRHKHAQSRQIAVYIQDDGYVMVERKPRTVRKVYKECTHCHVEDSPVWRRGPDAELLCNACGLFIKTHKRKRPLNEDASFRPAKKPTCDQPPAPPAKAAAGQQKSRRRLLARHKSPMSHRYSFQPAVVAGNEHENSEVKAQPQFSAPAQKKTEGST
ncbi:hypothetical protein RI367_007589 [Sorochytrium milnesiophthora]